MAKNKSFDAVLRAAFEAGRETAGYSDAGAEQAWDEFRDEVAQ